MSTIELTSPGRGRGRRTKLAPYTRRELDGRSVAARQYDAMEARILKDLGDNISEIERSLVTTYCSIAITLQDMGTRSLLGQSVALSDLTLAASTLVRIAQRLGLTPRAKGATAPTIADVLRAGIDQEHEHAA
jgi:hypothetical protein